MDFSHLDETGRARMVDVSSKPVVKRTARARGELVMDPATVAAIRDQALPKGDVLTIAKVAGINFAKQGGNLIPLCHPVILDHVDVTFELADDRVKIESVAICAGRTGVEMEALNAVCGAALGVYDMCKAVDKGMHLEGVRLVDKTKEPLS